MEWMDAFERWAPGVGPHRIEEALYNVSLQLILAGGDWGFVANTKQDKPLLIRLAAETDGPRGARIPGGLESDCAL